MTRATRRPRAWILPVPTVTVGLSRMPLSGSGPGGQGRFKLLAFFRVRLGVGGHWPGPMGFRSSLFKVVASVMLGLKSLELASTLNLKFRRDFC